MKIILSILVFAFAFKSYAAGIVPAVVQRTPVMNLGAVEIPEVTLLDVKSDADGVITYAKMKIDVKLKPTSCDVFFTRGEILAQVEDEDRSSDSPTRKITFGSLHEIDVASACIGVASRPATLTLDLINGIRKGFDKDRTINVLVKAIDETKPWNPNAYWNIVILANQKQGKLEVNTITLFTLKK